MIDSGAELTSYRGPGQLVFLAFLDLKAWPFNQVSKPETIETSIGSTMVDVQKTRFQNTSKTNKTIPCYSSFIGGMCLSICRSDVVNSFLRVPPVWLSG